MRERRITVPIEVKAANDKPRLIFPATTGLIPVER
jgi:hypothetical protein